jgi:probable HAF family extracellular repeat protein
MQDLGALGANDDSVALGINDSGEIVGFDNNAIAFLWTKTGGMKDLNSLIPPNSGWTLNHAAAINTSGQITGYGQFQGATHAFLLTPVGQASRPTAGISPPLNRYDHPIR